MKLAPLVLLVALVVQPVAAQNGDAKAKLQQVLASAQQAYDQKRLEQAEEILNEARSLVHDDAKAVMLRAQVNFELGEFGKAETFAGRATELAPNDVEAKLLRSKSLFQQAEAAKASPLNSGTRINAFYEGAIVELDKVAKIKPDHPELMALKAECLFWLDRVPEAIELWEARRKAKPDDPEPLLRIAQMQLRLKNEDAALKAATDGLVTKGPSSLRGDLAGVVFAVLNPRGKLAEMFAAFKAWNAAHPDDPQAYLWMGYTRAVEKNFDEAVTLYQKGFDVSGKKHSGIALETGNVLFARGDAAKGDLPKAAEWYGTALKLQSAWNDPVNNPLVRLNAVAGSFVQKGEYAKGIEILEKHALPGGLSDRDTMNNLGLFYRDWADRGGRRAEGKAKNEKALEYYLKASKLVLDDETATPKQKAQVLNDTGVIYDYQLGDLEKGIDYYRQALKQDGTYIDALENLARCFNKLGKYEEAIPLFQKVLDKEPARRVSLTGMSEARKAVEKDQKPTSR
jgi:tetratricopeptide (TPR) repeat protein